MIGRQHEALDVFVATQGVWVLRGDETGLAVQAGLDEALPRFEAWLHQQPAIALRVWLSGALCRPFLVPPVAGVRSSQDLAVIAQAQAATQSGVPAPCAVWLEALRPNEAIVAAAMPQALRERCLGWAGTGAASATRVLSLRPWWSAAPAAAIEQGRARGAGRHALLVRDPDSVVFLMGEGARFSQASAFAPIVADEQAAAVRSRLTLSHDLHAQTTTALRLNPGGRTRSPWPMPLAAWVQADEV
jgi:hypothetical protein